MTKGNTLTIGVIGCGQIAQAVHLPILERLPGVRVTALADVDAARLSQAGARVPRAARFSDYARLLATAQVDAVVVCVPPALHAEVAIAALQADKHVYLEKPLATTLDDGERVCESLATVGSGRDDWLQLPLQPAVSASPKRSVRWPYRAGGRRPISLRDNIGRPARLEARSLVRRWRGMLDLASHDIDLVHFILGDEVVEAFADVRSLTSEGDSAVFQMRVVSGIPAQIFVSLGTAEEAVFEVYGQRGKVTVNRYQSVAARVTGTRVDSRVRRLWNSVAAVRELPWFIQRLRAPANEPSFAAALAHFFGAIRGHHCACPDFFDGYRSLSVIAAAEESARTGRPVPTGLPGRAGDSDRGTADAVASHDLRSELP